MLQKTGVTMHPGQMLLEGYLKPLRMTQLEFARRVGLSPPMVNQIITGYKGISSRLAIILGDALGTGPEFWVRLQADYDFTRDREAMRREKRLPKRVEPLYPATTADTGSTA